MLGSQISRLRLIPSPQSSSPPPRLLLIGIGLRRSAGAAGANPIHRPPPPVTQPTHGTRIFLPSTYSPALYPSPARRRQPHLRPLLLPLAPHPHDPPIPSQIGIMDPSPPRRRSVLSRALLLAVAVLALRLLYGAFLAVSAGWPLSPSAVLPATAARRTHVQADVPSPDAWRTRDWRKAVDYHAAVLAAHLADGILAPGSRAVCLGGAQEALAMRELGVANAVAVARKRAPPLVLAADSDGRRLPFEASSVDFVFGGRALDSARRPADLAAEAARILRPDGHLVLLTSSAADAYSRRSLQALLPSLRLVRSREINVAQDEDGASTLRELVFQKKQPGAHTTSVLNNCSIGGDHKLQLLTHAEPLIQEEPPKPWITLKRNINNIKYLPDLADISFKRRYVYVDVGARSYGSSIGSWFRKRYPKQNHTFEVFAIEADPAFHSEYASKKGVALLPYAAWVKNETLKFEIHGDHPGKEEDEAKANNGRGMGRIRPAAGKKMSGEVRSVPAFDFAEWLKRTVTEQDYVVMKMDVEGTEFDLIPRLFDTGAICLVDELFLECHYNRWQKCCPGERSPKYDNTYEECLDLFSSLRDSGVLVHQWW